MKPIKTSVFILLLFSFWSFSSCDNNGDFLLFSIQNDIDLGQQVAREIAENPEQYPLLDRNEKQAYEDAYQYLESMMNEILASDEVTYRDEFPWQIHIIDDDQTLNAFATPGGQIYVYTGLIFFLDQQDDLAGVLGHEVAHSDQRHSSKQLQRQYTIAGLLAVLTGEQSETIQEIARSLAGLGSLEFSRDAERESDEFSVRYLSDTQYACNGAASFFEKLIARGESGVEVPFLSTHPQPDDRVSDITSFASSIGCSTAQSDPERTQWENFRDLLRQ
ncbi:MAG: M48 family metalloprotease [Bacteroidota bacterium]